MSTRRATGHPAGVTGDTTRHSTGSDGARAVRDLRAMSTTQITPSPRGAVTLSNEAHRPARDVAAEPLTTADVLEEVLPLIGVVVVAGPPAIILIGFFALFALAVCGAFLLLVTYVLVAAAIVALGGATVAMTYQLVCRVAGRWTGRAQPAMRPVALETRRAFETPRAVA